MAEFSITSASLQIGDDTYCASNVTVSYTAEPIEFHCLGSANPDTYEGINKWSSTATLAYTDDDAGMSPLWGATATLTFEVTTSEGGTVTLTGDVVITDVTSTFSKTEVPQCSITMIGDGDLVEANVS